MDRVTLIFSITHVTLLMIQTEPFVKFAICLHWRTGGSCDMEMTELFQRYLCVNVCFMFAAIKFFHG